MSVWFVNVSEIDCIYFQICYKTWKLLLKLSPLINFTFKAFWKIKWRQALYFLTDFYSLVRIMFLEFLNINWLPVPMHGIVIPFLSEVLFLQFNGVSQVKYIIWIAKSHMPNLICQISYVKSVYTADGKRSNQRIVKTGIINKE